MNGSRTIRNSLNVLMAASLFAAFNVVFLTEALAQPQPDERQSFPQVDTMSPLGVNMQTGRFIEQGVDFQIGPLVVDHYFTFRSGPTGGIRSPRSYATSLRGFGYIVDNSASGSTTSPVGHVQLGTLRVSFDRLASGSWFPRDSANTGWKMVDDGSDWILTNKSGEEYHLAQHPALASSERVLMTKTSASGHQLQYSYNSSGRLVGVTSNRGFKVVFEYSGTSTSSTVVVCGYNLASTPGASANSCASSDLKATYVYGTNGISSITGVDQSVVNFTHHSTGGIACITLPNSSTCRIQNQFYTPPPGGLMPGIYRLDHVVQQTTAEGEVWNYTHIAVENFSGDYTPSFGEIQHSYSSMSPPDGGGGSFTFGNGFLEEVSGAVGEAIYEYSSNAAYAVAYRDTWTGPHYYSVYPSKVTYPEGNSVSFVRDWADNVTIRIEKAKPGSGLADRVTSWTYPTSYQWSSPTICDGPDVLCDKPTKVRDPRGNETDITYDSTHGGVLTRTGPADANGVRPQTRYTYVQRNARDASGTALQPPIWVLDSEEYCVTSAAVGDGCAGGSADEVVTTYDYGPTSGPNNLLLRGTAISADGETLLTCFLYDELGRKIAETRPKGTGSTCP